MLEELSWRIWRRPEFHRDYRALLRASAQNALGIEEKVFGPDEEVIARLLQAAVHFAGTSNSLFRHAAYEMGVAAWNCVYPKTTGLVAVVECIFSRLGNFAASSHLHERRGGHDSVVDLPLGLWFETEAHRAKNSVDISSSKTLLLTDFQHDLWQALNAGQSVAVVAPTSAGKSYALQYFVALAAVSDGDSVVYVVPTRALITQVSAALERIVEQIGVSKRIVSTVPVAPQDIQEKRLLYVLTQERLQLLLDSDVSLRFSLIAVDEAHLIGDAARGVLLQHVVDRAIARSGTPQLLFLSPFISNPEVFQKTFDLVGLSKAISNEPSVSQHLIFVDRTERDDEVIIRASLGGVQDVLGVRRLQEHLFSSDEMLSYLSWYFGRGQQNLVYSGGPASCEEIARRIADLEVEACEKESQKRTSPALKEFSQFLRDHIHSEFLLAQTIEHGVAFHYGNMPSVVRMGIEDLFSEGEVQFLVCTSTLLHGVNFPARNLFLLNPTRGKDPDTRKDIPLDPVDFWNLAGRAGRMGKEFEGFVYLLDYKNWSLDPTKGERTQEVHPALYSAIEERQRELVEFIRDADRGSGVDPELENTFSKLYVAYDKGQLGEVLSRASKSITAEQADEIERALEVASRNVDLPLDVVDKNPTVSPIRQQLLYDYIVTTLNENGAEVLLPVYPLSKTKSPYQSLLTIFKAIHTYLEGRPEKDGSHAYFATLALHWMRGDSLAKLIDNAHNRRVAKSKRGMPSVGTTIREVFGVVEKDLRFRYVKFTKCYSDLLVHALKESSQAGLVEQIPPLPLFLELGASSRSMVSLISIGLSRTTAGILASKTRQSMDRVEALSWLRRQNLAALDLPSPCVREIKRVL